MTPDPHANPHPSPYDGPARHPGMQPASSLWDSPEEGSTDGGILSPGAAPLNTAPAPATNVPVAGMVEPDAEPVPGPPAVPAPAVDPAPPMAPDPAAAPAAAAAGSTDPQHAADGAAEVEVPSDASPLRSRLAALTAVVAALPALLLTVVALYAGFQEHTRNHREGSAATAAAMAELLRGAVRADGEGAPAVLQRTAAEAVERLMPATRTVFLEVTDGDGNVLLRPKPHRPTQAALAELPGRRAASSVRLTEAGRLAVHRLPIESGAGGFLAVGVLDRDTPALIEPWMLLLAACGVGAALAGGGIALAMVLEHLRPLLPLRRAVNSLRLGERPAPLGTTGDSELYDVAHAINAMVERIYFIQDEMGGVNQRLEQQVEARTVEVRRMNDRLEAEAADKNEFLRAVTHDLNAPLRNIIGMVSMVMMKHGDKLPEDGLAKLQRIEANAKHQTELIGDLLELSRLRTRKPTPERVDLDELIGGIVSNLGHDLESAEIALRVEGDMPTIAAERTRVRQVFQNLIDNAIKYMMDAERREIVVRSTRTRDFQPDIFNGVDVLQFSVADTGRGIAAQDVDRVFQVFNRSTHSGTHEVAGRGVGLASVRAIVEQMGGRIWVESELNRGSTFSFTLPAATALDLDALDRARAGGAPTDAEEDEEVCEATMVAGAAVRPGAFAGAPNGGVPRMSDRGDSVLGFRLGLDKPAA